MGHKGASAGVYIPRRWFGIEMSSIGEGVHELIDIVLAVLVSSLMLIVVSYVAFGAMESVYQTLLALSSPWYVWIIVALGFGGILSLEIKEVLAGGVLVSLIAGYLAVTMADWPVLLVIVSAWGFYLSLRKLGISN